MANTNYYRLQMEVITSPEDLRWKVGPNGEDRLITGPPGDEWVGQAVTPDCGC
ncbi:unnamed protein product [Tetraodon nigroviridis]|uniref:(spotted green pufferfish) hypothetical protein n=1 Tax=Tetraodon nigroviridis TaxID=99883 RepID=Q4RUW7_TETNG|nr:unnamed protein product [Tetraodon nigroviridis]